MYRPRVIPVLLLKGRALVKTIKFRKPVYLGDPINAVKIFNDMEADELIFLDIDATREKRCIDAGYIREIAEEAYMPFSVGGGITTLDDVETLISNGAEKVVISSSIIAKPDLITNIAKRFGSQSVVACVDIKRSMLGDHSVYIRNGSFRIKESPIIYIKNVIDMGAGEIMIQSIDRDGTFAGYDVEFIKQIAYSVSVPVVACGGATNARDLINLYKETHIQGLAAGSLFLFQKGRKSFLINYFDAIDKNKLREI